MPDSTDKETPEYESLQDRISKQLKLNSGNPFSGSRGFADEVKAAEGSTPAATDEPPLDDLLQQFVDYLKGDSPLSSDAIPVFKQAKDLAIERFTIGVCVTLLDRIMQVPSLRSFLNAADERLFNSDEVDTMAMSTLEKRREIAYKTLWDTMEFTRKFSIQNRDLLTPDNTPRTDLIKALENLPDSVITEILSTVRQVSGQK